MDKVTWFELPADDTKRASDFYSKVFGWKLSDMGGGSTMTITTPSDEQGTPKEAGAINGDISPRGKAVPHPIIVVTVDDLDEKVRSVEAEGGKVVVPRMELADMHAAYAVVSDTEGNALGIWQNL